MKRDPSPRTGNPRSAVSVARILGGCGFFIWLGCGAYWSARLAWADHLSRRNNLSSRIQAVRLFPSATLYDRLAQIREELGANPISDLEQAAALDPENAEPRLRLGLRAELAGDFGLAERNLLDAVALSRLYQPRYLLAQYYFRRQNADEFWRWSSAALGTAYGDVTPLLDLCWRMRPEAEWFARLTPAGHTEIAGQFLLYLAYHRQVEGARTLARRIAGTARSEDLPILFAYIDACLSQDNSAAATEVWNALCLRRLQPDHVLDPAGGLSLTNRNFDHAPTGQGFDWRMEKAAWLDALYRHGEMRLTFWGDQPENCLVASQFVPVVPGRRYRLALVSPAGDASSLEALGWVISAPSGAVLPTEPGSNSFTFVPQTEVVRLGLFYRRLPGSTRLAGTLSIGGARLDMVR